MKLYQTLFDACRFGNGRAFNPTGAAPKLPSKEEARNLTQSLYGAVPFDFSNVIDWLHDNLSAKTNSITEILGDFPPCYPPYEICFVSVSSAGGDHIVLDEDAMLVVTTPMDDGRYVTVLYAYTATDFGFLGPIASVRLIFDRYGNLEKKDLNGKLLPNISMLMLSPFDRGLSGEKETLQEVYLRITQYMLVVTLFGFSLCHCKNVTERHERLPRQQARQRERRKQPPIVWKTLHIDPVQKPRTPQEVADSLDPKHIRRMHLCRGHFAEYGPQFSHPDGTPKGKLFGRIDGRFWIPPMVKGNADTGLVVKDYTIDKPKGRTSCD